MTKRLGAAFALAVLVSACTSALKRAVPSAPWMVAALGVTAQVVPPSVLSRTTQAVIQVVGGVVLSLTVMICEPTT